ncbi:MAG: gliding motility-associated C-terminal domain-containing protein [Flavobacteriales bacterium]|nr:gliding motility-associated C-terminal domain-containing protein [Flavobacteriales bacterium]
MKLTFRCILTALVLCVFTPQLTAQYYWTGVEGEWGNPAMWSSEPNGTGGFGVPGMEDDVIFNTSFSTVTIQNSAFCNNLIVQNGVSGAFSGNLLSVHGDVVIQGEIATEINRISFDGGTVQSADINPEIDCDVFITNNSTLALQHRLLLPRNTIQIVQGHLDATGRAIVCDAFLASNSHTHLALNGSKIVVETSLDVQPSVSVDQLDDTVYPCEGSTINEGALLVNWGRDNTCGNGPGQTPFTVTTTIITDYNGEDVSCNDAEDGEAFAGVIGGVGPFSYTWVGGPNTPNYPGIGAGTYTVLVEDLGQGIVCVDNVQLTEPAPLTVFNFTYDPPSCAGECNGSGSPIVIGGVSPYDFDWGNGETNQFATMLCEGLNSLEIIDQNGCVFDTSFTVELDQIFVNLDITDVLCNGTPTGAATSTPTGGDGGPYTISWSTSDNGPTVTGLPADTYVVTVEDGSGCSVDSTFIVSEEPPVVIALDDVTDPLCADSNDGAIDISVSGGTPTYLFDWVGPNGFVSDQEDISGLEAGDYDITVTDDNGCQTTTSITLTGPPAIVANETITDVLCFGEFTGSISIDISGGTAGYDTDWTGPNGFVSVQEDISGLEAGDYTVVITDAIDCEATFTYTVDEPEEIVVTPTITPISCNGVSDGEIEITISGGTPDYTIEWTGPNGFTSDQLLISNLEEGDYNLTVTDDAGCEVTELYTLDNPAPIEITIDLAPISCEGAADASADITVTGGTPDYTFEWTGPNGFTSNQEDISGLDEGVYNLVVTDDAGCTLPASLAVSNPDPIVAVLVPTDVSCGGSDDGSIELSILGGQPGYQTDWIGPNGFTSDQEDLSGLIAGDYTVTITDIAGCEIEETITINELPPLELVFDVTPISCNGANDGAIDLTITGGQPQYVIGWAGPNLFISEDEDIFDLEPGFYNVLVIDVNDCFIEGFVEITEPDPIDVTVDSSDPTCFDSNDGTITLTISGGVDPITVSWDSGDNGAALTDLPAGDYIPTITDDSGCEVVLPAITLTAPEEIIITTDETPILCGGEATGAIDMEFTGGQGTVQIAWTGPNGFTSDQEDIADLEAGTYDLVLTDEAGCQAFATVDILEPLPLDVQSVIAPLNCADDLGSIELTISGGTTDYTIAWTGPNGFISDQAIIINLEQGTYDLVVTDALDCEYTETFDLVAPDPLEVTSDVTDLQCGSGPIGAVDLTITGGTLDYTILWTGPGGFSSNAEDITDLGEGTYDVSVTDAGGCEVLLSFEFIQPEELDIEVTTVEPACFGENTGSISIVITGGVDPYDVIWTGPNGFSSTATDITNLVAGSYDLGVTDAGTCASSLTIDLDEPEELNVVADITDIICGGANSGAIDITIEGGQGPFDVVWSAPGFNALTEDIFDLEAGSYTLDILDNNGCSFTASYDVSETVPIDITLDTADSSCNESNGSASVTTTGGLDPVTITWYDEDFFEIGTGLSIADLPAGTYVVEATDGNDCVMGETFSISDSDAIQLEADATDPLCAGDTNGTIDLTLTGGTGTITIAWSGPDGFVSDQEDLADLQAGIYSVEATDEAGCIAALTVELLEPETLDVQALITGIACGTSGTGAIELDIAGGTGNIIVDWVGPNSFTSNAEDIFDLEAGDYTVLVTDESLCTFTTTYEVPELTSVEVEFVLTQIECNGANDGAISTTVTSGTPAFDFLWTGPDGFSSVNADLALLAPGDYTLTITDDNDCTVEETVTITENPALELEVIEAAPACNAADGALEAVVTGGTVGGDYTYFWYDLDNGNTLIGTDAIIEDLPAGQYFVEVFDDLGCLISAQVPLANNVGEITAVLSDPLCFSDFNGVIDATITGATDPLTISWTGPNGFASDQEDIADLEGGEYIIEVLDGAGCILTETFTLVAPEELILTTVGGDLLCATQAAGTVIATIEGGTEDYTIAWVGPNGFTSEEQNLSDLLPGCYDLQVTDANACLAISQACIDAPDSIQVDAIPTNIACFGELTGSIEIETEGGVGGFTYDWSGPNEFASDDEDIFDLAAGAYDLIITDANFCELDTFFIISQNPQVIAVADTILPSCPGFDDGQISLTISGGQGPYTPNWFEGGIQFETGEVATNLDAGTYEVQIQDAFGCLVVQEYELVDPIPFEIDSVVTPIACFGEGNGSIEIDVSGGTGDLTTLWVGPNGYTSANEDIFDLEAGSYELTLGDELGCTMTFDFTIVEPEAIDVSIENLINASCLTSEDGSILINIQGGVEPYEFAWSGPDGFTFDQEDLIDAPTGTYDLLITDDFGCTFELTSIPLGFNGNVEADAGPDVEQCDGIALEVIGTQTGGTTEFWSDLDGEQVDPDGTLSVELEPGEYTFVYNAVDGPCFDTDTINVTIFALPEVDAGEDQDVYFEEQVVIGGSPTTDVENVFTWTPSELLVNDEVLNPQTVEVTADTWYFIEVVDINGCVAQDSVFISLIPQLDVVSGFTPNGDGMNDFWDIGNTGFYPTLVVSIYNRWGDLLFQDGNGYAQPWDGTYNGTQLPIGTYYYVIDIDEPEFKATMNGPVTILR